MYIDTIGFRFRVLCTSYEYDRCANLKCKRADFLNTVPLKLVASFEALHIPNWLIKTKNIFFCHIHLFTYYKVANTNNGEFNDLTAFNKGMCQVLKHLCVWREPSFFHHAFFKTKSPASPIEKWVHSLVTIQAAVNTLKLTFKYEFLSRLTLLHICLLWPWCWRFLICRSKFHEGIMQWSLAKIILLI